MTIHSDQILEGEFIENIKPIWCTYKSALSKLHILK